tara:strand:+ start:11687 stop:12592 length:906 start_codon:yes stop_codon:yes gene_type:complete
MIITRILGGLGNQMFQYACGSALADQYSVSHYLDLSAFSGYASVDSDELFNGMALHQGFQLSEIFGCDILEASDKTIKAAIGWRSKKYAKDRLHKNMLSPLRGRHFIVDDDGIEKIDAASLQKGVYLSAYWQNEKYFIGAESQIRKQFAFKIPLVERNTEISEAIRKSNSVSIHVRRGDYVSNANFTSDFPVCSLDYYNAAIKNITSYIPDPTFFVFSDSVEWTKSNLVIPYPVVYVDNNQGQSSYQDMHLMSLCDHNIIANSSFSWWGAWLNKNNSKMVVAPKLWFKNAHFDHPSNWITL